MYLIILLLMIPYSIIINAYAQTNYVLCEYPDYSPTQCIDASKAMMKGRRFRYIYLMVSFIGMEILGVLSLFIGSLWIEPYRGVSDAQLYLDMLDEKRV